MDRHGGAEWESLPLEVCHVIIDKVSKSWHGRDSVQALLETSKPVNEIAASLIRTLIVKDFGDLERFPSKARLEKLVLAAPAHMLHRQRFHTPGLALCWLLASPRARLGSIKEIDLSIILDDPPKSNVYFGRLLGAIHDRCPDCTHISVHGEYDDPARKWNPAFFRTLDSFPGNLTVLDLCGDYALPVEWQVVLPQTLQRLQARRLVGTDCVMRCLAKMPRLKHLMLDEIKLSKGCVIDSVGCAWERLYLCGHERGIDADNIESFTEWPPNVWCTTEDKFVDVIVKFGVDDGDSRVDLTRTVVERLAMWKWARGGYSVTWHEQEHPRDAQEGGGTPSICFSWEGGNVPQENMNQTSRYAVAAIRCLSARARPISIMKWPIFNADMIKAAMLVATEIRLIECRVNCVELFLQLGAPSDRTLDSLYLKMCPGTDFEQCCSFASTVPREMSLDVTFAIRLQPPEADVMKLRKHLAMRLGQVREARTAAGLPPFELKIGIVRRENGAITTII